MWNSLIIIAFFLMAIILPLINRSKINNLIKEINHLKLQLKNLNEASTEIEISPLQKNITIKSNEISIQEPIIENKKSSTSVPKKVKKDNKDSFEQQFGMRLPIWIGGIALILAGFFMVKYSIESNLLSPTVRVSLGAIFGVSMLHIANFIRDKPKISNGPRIAQALSGAGIADLYICVFAATNLYDIIPGFIGFIGMAIITAIAVFLSLKHGMPIALISLIGGLLTPAMMNSNNPSAAMLFLYLYFVVSGLLWVIRKNNWWKTALLAIIGAFSWVIFWILFGHYSPMNSVYLTMFLIAISATVVTSLNKELTYQAQQNKTKLNSASILKYLTIAGTILITALITSSSGFGLFEWSLFGLLSLAGIGLAYFDQKLYGFVPLLSMIVIAVMLISWSTVDSANFAIVISAFAMLYILSGYLIQNRCLKPLKWSILTCSTAMIYYIIAYYKLKYAVFLAVIPHLWSMIALLLAICSLYSLQRIIQYLPKNHSQKQHLMASYALTVTAFVALSFAVAIPKDFLYIALSAEILAVAWINTKLNITALRSIAIALSCIVALLLTPQILLIIQLSVYNLIEAKISLQSLPSLTSPILQLGLPALFLGFSSYFFRIKKDSKFVQYLELSSIALISIMGYYFIRSIFHNNEEAIFIKTSFVERGITTNIIFLFGLLCITLGIKFKREMISMSGIILSFASIFRILYFDCWIHNPLWTIQEVGSLPILNALLLAYGLPIVWTWHLSKELLSLKKLELAKYSNYFMLLSSFIFVSLNIRQMFQGSFLNGKITSIAEIYTYSVAWIIFGIALLFIGTLRNNKMIRIASLIVMIITIGKVFLYDTSELEGLYRVFSFFGLGICLLALSSFYSRFIFNQKKAPTNI